MGLERVARAKFAARWRSRLFRGIARTFSQTAF